MVKEMTADIASRRASRTPGMARAASLPAGRSIQAPPAPDTFLNHPLPASGIRGGDLSGKRRV